MMSLGNKEHLPYYIGAGVIGITVTILLMKKLYTFWAARRSAQKRKNYPADTVILHQFTRGPYAPSMSPFPLKLETYLRMAEIPYQNEVSFNVSSKGKTPWITYNGEDVADSQFCIDYLTKKLGKDCNSHLTRAERAIARAFQKMIEENLYWVLALHRWVYNSGDLTFVKMGLPSVPTYFLKKVCHRIKEQAHGHGMGRHTQEEVYTIARGDLTALSDFLGNKKFLMGDKPCETDCAMFGMLAQIKWQAPDSPHSKMVNEDFPNLSAYCERMKNRFWPDWEECNTSGGTKEATK